MSSPADPDLSALSPLASELASTIARVASDIVLVLDANGFISSVAEGAAVQAQGCSRWVGQRWVDTVTAGTRPKIQSLLDEVASSGVVSRRREVSHPGQGGDDLPVTWSAIRLGADGPVLAVGRDLRAVAAIQQRFVEALQDTERHYWNRRQAESRYQLLYQVANDAMLVLDAQSLQVLEANAAAAELLGHDLAAIRGRPLTDSLPMSASVAVAELLGTARSTGRASERRVRTGAAQGALDFSATPFRAGGQQQLLLRVRRDSADGGAADSLALSRMIDYVESTPDAVVVTDSAGGILMASPAFLRMTSQTHEARLRGRPVSALMRDADSVWDDLVAQVSEAGMVSNAALTFKTLDGIARNLWVSGAMLPEGEQACLGFVLRPDHRLPPLVAGEDLMSGLLDQVGRMPLSDLLAEIVHRAERQLIASALLRTGGQALATAHALGLSAETLESRIQRHGLAGLRYPTDAAGLPPLVN